MLPSGPSRRRRSDRSTCSERTEREGGAPPTAGRWRAGNTGRRVVGPGVKCGCQRSSGDLGTASDRPLRRQDSNLDHRNQNPRCCLYTTAEERAPTRRHMVPRPLRSPQRHPPQPYRGGIAESASGHHRRRADNLRFSYLCHAGRPGFRRRCEHDGTAAWRPSAPVDMRSTGR